MRDQMNTSGMMPHRAVTVRICEGVHLSESISMIHANDKRGSKQLRSKQPEAFVSGGVSLDKSVAFKFQGHALNSLGKFSPWSAADFA